MVRRTRRLVGAWDVTTDYGHYEDGNAVWVVPEGD